MDKSTNLDDLCRLCGELEHEIIPVFGDEGRRQCLREKIENNAKVIVSENDELPRGICAKCNDTLSNISNFVDQCQETQDKLQEFLTIQQSMWMVDSMGDQPDTTSDYEDSHEISHHIDIPLTQSKDDSRDRNLASSISNSFISSIAKESSTFAEKDLTQTLEIQQLLQETQADGNALLRLPTSTSVETTPRIVSVVSNARMTSNLNVPVKVLGSAHRPTTLAAALKGREITSNAAAVKVIRQIHTVDDSDIPNGKQRKKMVFVVSKPPNVEIPTVVSAVLQSKNLAGNTPRRVATVTTGELVSVDDPLLTPCIVKRPPESSELLKMEEPTSDPDITVVAATSNARTDDGTIITLKDSETSGKVHIRLRQQPEEVTIIDNLKKDEFVETLERPEFVAVDIVHSSEEAEDPIATPVVTDTQRRENMRRQMVRRAYLAREKSKRRAERARVTRAAVKKVRDDEKVRSALTAMEEMMKQRESEDLTVRNKPLPPEFRKIKRMLARRGLLPEKAIKKKRIDMPYKDKVAEHIAKLSPTQFQCKLCLETFRWNYKCEQHILNHTGERPFKCHICGKSYKENCVLDQHMRMHKDKYLFVCEECGAGFKRRYLLSYHTRRYHGEEVRLLCEDCGKVFHSRETLNAHVRYHHKKRMVVCDVCGQVVRHSEMGRHRRKHGPLSSCPLCNRQFRRQDARERHIQEHDNPTLPAHCIACGKYFRGRRSLMEHLERVHNMEPDGTLEAKLEPEDSLPCPEEEDIEGDEDSRASHVDEKVHIQVHDFMDTDDVGATQQISLGEDEETRAASNVLDEIAATVLLQ